MAQLVIDADAPTTYQRHASVPPSALDHLPKNSHVYTRVFVMHVLKASFTAATGRQTDTSARYQATGASAS